MAAASEEGCDNKSLAFTFQSLSLSERVSLSPFGKKYFFTSAAASERPWRLSVRWLLLEESEGGGIVASNSFRRGRELAVGPRTSN